MGSAGNCARPTGKARKTSSARWAWSSTLSCCGTPATSPPQPHWPGTSARSSSARGAGSVTGPMIPRVPHRRCGPELAAYEEGFVMACAATARGTVCAVRDPDTAHPSAPKPPALWHERGLVSEPRESWDAEPVLYPGEPVSTGRGKAGGSGRTAGAATAAHPPPAAR
ncbi:hypothetical protein FRAHR75_840018 [Frankia sp. Hr75.2]|nr:hypothetical protein FRAHR75_840018 [Frankia sp. Hr75.2]